MLGWTYCGWTKSIPHHFEPSLQSLFVGIYRRIIIPGFPRWCRILSIHSRMTVPLQPTIVLTGLPKHSESRDCESRAIAGGLLAYQTKIKNEYMGTLLVFQVMACLGSFVTFCGNFEQPNMCLGGHWTFGPHPCHKELTYGPLWYRASCPNALTCCPFLEGFPSECWFWEFKGDIPPILSIAQ